MTSAQALPSLDPLLYVRVAVLRGRARFKLMVLFIVKWIFSIVTFPASGFILSLTILPMHVNVRLVVMFVI